MRALITGSQHSTAGLHPSMNDLRLVVMSLVLVLLLPLIISTSVMAAPGNLDTSFNGTGIVLGPSGVNTGWGNELLIQNDGKSIVLTGYALFRHLPNGQPDSSFGINGRLDLPTGFPTAMALQSDGKILVASSDGTNALIIRFMENGSVDSAFGTNGIVSFLIGTSSSRINSIKLMSDGRIVTAGYSRSGFDYALMLTQHLQNGAFDTSFGSNGVALPARCQSAISLAGFETMIVLPDDRIVALDVSLQCIHGYHSDGSIDLSFGTNGIVDPDIGVADIAYSPLGKIVAVGKTTGALAIQQFAMNGTVDNGFGINGVSSIVFPINSYIHGLTIAPSGKIFATGMNYTSTVADPRLFIASYLPDGSMDTRFGNGGIAVPYEAISNVGYAVAVQTDGKILVTGSNQYLNTQEHPFILIRLLGDSVTPSNIPTLSWHALVLLVFGLGLIGWVYRYRFSSMA